MAKPKRGDMVYLVSDPDQVQRQVVDVVPVKYVIRIGNDLVEVFDIEMTEEPDQLKKILHGGSKED
jgi:hypothetical protein